MGISSKGSQRIYLETTFEPEPVRSMFCQVDKVCIGEEERTRRQFYIMLNASRAQNEVHNVIIFHYVHIS